MANAVAHMSAIIGNKIKKEQLVSGDVFVGTDDVEIPRNSQYPIIIKRANEQELHKLYDKIGSDKLPYHVFIKEMQDTSNDEEIVSTLRNQSIKDTTFYGVTFFAPNEQADQLTKNFQLFK